jgi:hypothetical protein
MLVHTIAVGLVISPEAIVDVSINMDEFTLAMGSVLSPLSYVLCSIWPLLFSKAVSETSFPLSDVYCSGFELIGRALLSLLIWLVCVFRYSFLRLFVCEVLAGAYML